MSDIETIGISLVLENGVAEGMRRMERDVTLLGRKTTLHAATMQRLADTHLRSYQTSSRHHATPAWQSSFAPEQRAKQAAIAHHPIANTPAMPQAAAALDTTNPSSAANVVRGRARSPREAPPQPSQPPNRPITPQYTRAAMPEPGDYSPAWAKTPTLQRGNEDRKSSTVAETVKPVAHAPAYPVRPQQANDTDRTAGKDERETDQRRDTARKPERPQITVALGGPALSATPDARAPVAIPLPPPAGPTTIISAAASPAAPPAQALANDRARRPPKSPMPEITPTEVSLISDARPAPPAALPALSPAAPERFLPIKASTPPVDYASLALPPGQLAYRDFTAVSLPPALPAPKPAPLAGDAARYESQALQTAALEPPPPGAPPSLPQTPASEPTTSIIQGELLIDGALMGNWLARTLAHQAARPPTGARRFNARVSPTWPGMPL